MKKLFLASSASNTLIKFVESLNCPTSDLKVAFVPTAGHLYEDNWFIEKDRNALINLGFNVEDINLENKNKSQLINEMNGIDIVFVAGGNTFYLLQEVMKSEFNEIIISFVEKGGMYIGSSAGSLLAGPSIELAQNIDDQNDAPELKSYDSLGLVDFVVMPHYDDEDFKDKIDSNLEKFSNYKYEIIKITDREAVLVEGDGFKIVSV